MAAATALQARPAARSRARWPTACARRCTPRPATRRCARRWPSGRLVERGAGGRRVAVRARAGGTEPRRRAAKKPRAKQRRRSAQEAPTTTAAEREAEREAAEQSARARARGSARQLEAQLRDARMSLRVRERVAGGAEEDAEAAAQAVADAEERSKTPSRRPRRRAPRRRRPSACSPRRNRARTRARRRRAARGAARLSGWTADAICPSCRGRARRLPPHAQFRVRKRTFAYFLDDHHGDGIVGVTCKAPGSAAGLIDANPDRFYCRPTSDRGLDRAPAGRATSTGPRSPTSSPRATSRSRRSGSPLRSSGSRRARAGSRGPRRRRSARAPRRTRAAARPRTRRRPPARAGCRPRSRTTAATARPPPAPPGRAHLLGQVEQEAEAEQRLARPRRPEPADDVGRDPERPRHGAVDALGDPAHAVLLDELDQPVRLQALDVVVDGLRRLAEHLADLRAGARLGELAQHLDALGLQQRVGLLDGLDVERVQHLQAILYVTRRESCKRCKQSMKSSNDLRVKSRP